MSDQPMREMTRDELIAEQGRRYTLIVDLRRQLDAANARIAKLEQGLNFMRIPLQSSLDKLSPVYDAAVPRNVEVIWLTGEDVVRGLLAALAAARDGGEG